ncbi:hypothetical protein CKK33_05620 [Mucilaginibacter sp. MD40]|uniref:DUF4270 domain-containing protein n=1 Tax=Mucilaginibacter sp. MD40 TaxID=2029590 RepID=UPI000BAC9EB2|nr:DUF4270 domain-containing protein [Mucilaginibacter sp. MD40]PAW92998.1 hypothetical protein CKK33_05620 [Mucilaginibacter sp. MD40]
MKFYKLGLLTLLISLFILSSCKRQEGIGLDVDPATQINGTLVVDTSLVATTVAEDSIPTLGYSSRVPLSYFKDPDFGVTHAGFATLLSLPGGGAYTVPTGTITIDSAVLSLPYTPTYAFYGDSLLSTFKVNVYQLAKNIQSSVTKTYYTNDVFATGDLIGTKTFKSRSHDTLRVYTIVKGKPDTIVKVVPQVRIPISKDFITNNLFEAGSVLSSNNAYQNYIKGLYIKLDEAQTTGVGGNMFFNADSAKVLVYYRATSNGTVDTTMLSMPLTNGLISIQHDYSDKVKAAMNQTNGSNLLYMQGMAGLRTKLSFPNVKNILAAAGNNAIINRAELVMKVSPGTGIPFAPNPRLTMYRYDLARQRVLLQDASGGDPRASGIFGGNYDATTGEYHFIVTAFLQDLVNGKTIDYGTFIAPVSPVASGTTVNIGPVVNYAERSILTGKNSPDRIRLKVIYTKINQ